MSAAPSILKSPLESKVLERCESLLSPAGYRIVDVDCRVGGKSLVRLFLERVGGDPTKGSATIEDCAIASRLIGADTEIETWFPGPFDLEVSSAGLERRLRLQSDFDVSIGKEVKLSLTERLTGRGANISGTIGKTEPGVVVVNVEKEQLQIPLSQIKRANLVWRAANH